MEDVRAEMIVYELNQREAYFEEHGLEHPKSLFQVEDELLTCSVKEKYKSLKETMAGSQALCFLEIPSLDLNFVELDQKPPSQDYQSAPRF